MRSQFHPGVVAPLAAMVPGLLLGMVLLTAAAARADDVTVRLGVREQGFDPAEIEVAAGSRVRLEITNHTAAAIEFESFELNRERVIQPTQTAAVYVSGLQAGRYEFFDDFHQERKGALVVR